MDLCSTRWRESLKKTVRFVTRKVRQLGQMIFFLVLFLFCSSSKILNSFFFPFDIVHSTRLVLVKLSSYRFANLILLHPYTIAYRNQFIEPNSSNILQMSFHKLLLQPLFFFLTNILNFTFCIRYYLDFVSEEI